MSRHRPDSRREVHDPCDGPARPVERAGRRAERRGARRARRRGGGPRPETSLAPPAPTRSESGPSRRAAPPATEADATLNYNKTDSNLAGIVLDDGSMVGLWRYWNFSNPFDENFGSRVQVIVARMAASWPSFRPPFCIGSDAAAARGSSSRRARPTALTDRFPRADAGGGGRGSPSPPPLPPSSSGREHRVRRSARRWPIVSSPLISLRRRCRGRRRC